MTGVTTCTPMNGPTLALFLVALICALALAFYWGAGWHKALMDSDPATLADVASGTRPASVGVDPAPVERCPRCQGTALRFAIAGGGWCDGCGYEWAALPVTRCPSCTGYPQSQAMREWGQLACAACGSTWQPSTGELAPLLVVDRTGLPICDAWSVGEAMEYVIVARDGHVQTRYEWARRADA